ncbi:hypothetical protein D3C71_1791500 [compost metagenome]
MGVDELLHFTFGDDVRRFRENLHDLHAVGIHHHLEGARMQKVADQHTGCIAKAFVGRRFAASHGRFVNHIVVQQGGGVDEFHHGCEIEALLAFVAQRAGHHQQQRRP